jgi:hypothetical protein
MHRFVFVHICNIVFVLVCFCEELKSVKSTERKSSIYIKYVGYGLKYSHP